MDAFLVRLERLGRPLYHIAKYRLRGKRPPVESDPPLAPHRRYYRSSWLRLLRESGLETEDWVCHGWGWYRSRLGSLAETVSRRGALVRRRLERRRGKASVDRAMGSLLRCRAVNWIPAEQLVRVRALPCFLGLFFRPMFALFELL
jgi:hypothetical protein